MNDSPDHSGANLQGADFSEEYLQDADFSGANLQDADFSGANLQDADFTEADLREADFTDAYFEDTTFYKSDMRGAKLPMDQFALFGEFTGADLRGIEFPHDLQYVQMEKSFLLINPVDWDPQMGPRDSENILSELGESEYFGPPTDEIGRLVCMEKWPNVVIEQATETFGWTADFSERSIHHANFSRAHLWGADFSGSFLQYTNFTDATLWLTDFSDANLRFADLSGADLRDANLSNADLRDANLTGADLRRTDLSNVDINGATKCDYLYENPDLVAEEWNYIARSYHTLRELFSESGLIGKARDYHVDQRKARGFEARAREGWRSPSYLGSKLSELFTGYGIRVRPLLTWMTGLFLLSTIWYVIVGVEDGILRNISYSVIAFTTAPSSIPSGSATQIVVMLETFLGTLFIVLLGYILGNRERF